MAKVSPKLHTPIELPTIPPSQPFTLEDLQQDWSELPDAPRQAAEVQ